MAAVREGSGLENQRLHTHTTRYQAQDVDWGRLGGSRPPIRRRNHLPSEGSPLPREHLPPCSDDQERKERDYRAFARAEEHETDLAARRTNGPRPTPGEAGEAGEASAFYDSGERHTQHVVAAVGRQGPWRSMKGLAWICSGRWRSRPPLDIPTRPGWVGAGFRLDSRLEAYNTELVALQRGLRSLVARQERGVNFAIFTDPQEHK